MSMYHGLDLSRFKKLASDKKTTTLQHTKGHELKIAHSSLSPEMRQKIDSMPVYLAKGGVASKESGEVVEKSGLPEGVSETDLDGKGNTSDVRFKPGSVVEEAVVPANLSQSYQDQGRGIAQGKPSDAAYSPDGLSGATAAAEPIQEAGNLGPVTEDPAGAVNPTGQYLAGQLSTGDYLGGGQMPPEQPEPTVEQRLAKEHDDFANELSMGKITPETYKSLFAKKDTLGKIGSIFGMIISGAGSGLAHQRNAMLDMLDRTIANDLDAQKASNVNSQNWYRLTQAHELQNANIGKIGAETAKIAGETGLIPAISKETLAKAGLTEKQMEVINTTLASNRSFAAAWQYLVDMGNNLPEGASKERWRQALAGLYPMYMEKILGSNNQAAGLINFAKSMTGGSEQGEKTKKNTSGINYQKMNQLQKLGERHVPGGMSGSDLANATEEARRVEKVDTLRDDYLKSFDSVSNMILHGKLAPNQRQAIIDGIAARMEREGLTRNQIEATRTIVDGYFPGVGDVDPRTVEIKRKQGQAFIDSLKAGTPTLERYGLYSPKEPDKPKKTSILGVPGGNIKLPNIGGERENKLPTTLKEIVGSKNDQPKKDVPQEGMVVADESFKPKDGDTGKYNGKPVYYRDGRWYFK